MQPVHVRYIFEMTYPPYHYLFQLFGFYYPLNLIFKIVTYIQIAYMEGFCSQFIC